MTGILKRDIKLPWKKHGSHKEGTVVEVLRVEHTSVIIRLPGVETPVAVEPDYVEFNAPGGRCRECNAKLDVYCGQNSVVYQCPTCRDTYVPGSIENRASLPVDYVLRGELLTPPEVGGRCIIFRLSRNGVLAPGVYSSTTVVELTDDGFVTQNSVYRLLRELSAAERAELLAKTAPSDYPECT